MIIIGLIKAKPGHVRQSPKLIFNKILKCNPQDETSKAKSNHTFRIIVEI